MFLVSSCTLGYSQPLEVFSLRKDQSVSEVFSNLADAYDTGERLQILVTPEIAERKLGDLNLRNMPIEASIRIICERFKLAYMKKGNLFVITGSPEAIESFNKKINKNDLPVSSPQKPSRVRTQISQMPVIGERPEFDMVWEMKTELDELRKRVATLEVERANQSH